MSRLPPEIQGGVQEWRHRRRDPISCPTGPATCAPPPTGSRAAYAVPATPPQRAHAASWCGGRRAALGGREHWNPAGGRAYGMSDTTHREPVRDQRTRVNVAHIAIRAGPDASTARRGRPRAHVRASASDASDYTAQQGRARQGDERSQRQISGLYYEISERQVPSRR
ncbi:hypothetical protein WOLCODRAFT_149348 [Wolfiporia cocos MD-104 SS10]|uniref:Uncharacterized protein n=1 Tax=Wolfiporia cocos (strain MD-104) TaxID=742152 RepID=A0A2H3JKZ7_WOLCO|nr:hypothetical protein WOLCODRAFT_149348 [Wolfiporia cocos MD-104 SS10]